MSLPTSLLRPAVATTLLAILNKVLQAAAGILLAYRFGASEQTDAFLLAKSLPVGLYLVGDSVLYNALVPYLKRHPKGIAVRRLIPVIVGTGLVCSVAVGLLAAPLVRLLAPGGADELLLRTAAELLRLCALALPFAFAASALKAHNASAGRHVLAALDGAVISGLAAVALWFAPDTVALRTVALAFPGACVVLLAVQALVAQGDARAAEPAGAWRALVAPMSLLGGLTLAQQAGQWFMNGLASFTEAGGIATLNFSYALAAVPVSVIDLVLFSTFFPFAAGIARRDGPPALGEAARGALQLSLVLTVPLALVLILLREPAVSFVLERGMFTGADTSRTATTLAAHAFAIPFWVAEAVACRALFALDRYGVYLRVSVLRLVCNVLLGAVLVGVWDVFGVALAFALSFVVGALLAWRAVRQHTH